MIFREQCPICGKSNRDSKEVFYRDFSPCSELVPFRSYRVYRCRGCGLVYAGDIEESMPLNDYYKQMSRYEGDNFTLLPKLQKHYRLAAEAWQSVIKQNAVILDVGCAFGGLLNEFRKLGYKDLCGLEPSRTNCDYAMKNYGIKVFNGSLGDDVFGGKKFDLVILSGVLEHLMEIRPSIRLCRELLKDDGILGIIVPDIAMFAEHKDLYQEFSIEHINYFGIDSLGNVMMSEGFLPESYVQDHESLMGLSGNMITAWRTGGGGISEGRSAA